MRKVVSPRNAARARSAGASAPAWTGWLEGLEARRMLSASSTLRITSIALTVPSLSYVNPFNTEKVKKSPAPTPGTEFDAQAVVGSAVQTYSGQLNGKIVYTSAGHGWQWSSTLGRY